MFPVPESAGDQLTNAADVVVWTPASSFWILVGGAIAAAIALALIINFLRHR